MKVALEIHNIILQDEIAMLHIKVIGVNISLTSKAVTENADNILTFYSLGFLNF